MLDGSVDKITSDTAVGWLFNRETKSKSSVHAVLHNEIIGHSVADLYRPDLEQVGFGDGHCGFEIKFHSQIAESHLPFVSIRPEGSSLSLPLTNNSVLLDLIGAVIKGFPGAGRHRSVLGGLWTDRSDAIQLLASRISLGICQPDLQTSLQAYITNGYIVVRDFFGKEGPDKQNFEVARTILGLRRETEKEIEAVQAGLTALVTFVFQKNIIRLLQAIFEDLPVAYHPEWIKKSQSPFLQVSAAEVFPSPTECLAVYFGGSANKSGIEYVRKSHELPEFTVDGQSRWIATGRAEVGQLAVASGASLDMAEFSHLDAVIVGPGLLHRPRATESAPIFRIICAPKRQTPQSFLTGDRMWIEASHSGGARIRL